MKYSRIHRSIQLALSIFALSALPALAQNAPTQNTPDFGPNVVILDPGMSTTQLQTTLLGLANEPQFSPNRHAILFKPGAYTIQAPVGYYESMAGLGETPGQVTINGFLTPNYGSTFPGVNVTDYFWRSLENMTINPVQDKAQNAAPNTLQWGVSQGTSLRRMQINGAVELTDSYCGYASGGFIADTVITGQVNPCSQQQWYTRNSSIGGWGGGVWNMVFSGVLGAPAQSFPKPPYTTLASTPISREKPFLYIDSNGSYNVFVPSTIKNGSGVSWANGAGPGHSKSIRDFFIAKPSNTADEINLALAFGKSLLLTPGVYQLNQPLHVLYPDTVVLGLAYATLVPQTGHPALTVEDVEGVSIAGLMIDAGPVNSPVLFRIGHNGFREHEGGWFNVEHDHHSSNPTTVNDVFFRVGGATAGSATTSLEVNSDNVILDNIWAWRADHGNGVGWTLNTADHGLIVNGDNVTALGLAVEHYQKQQVVWNGNNGETIFYQSELPYDVPSQSAWTDHGVDGYPSYFVSDKVCTHHAFGLGVYSFFNQGINIIDTSAIKVPNTQGISITDAVSVFLTGSGSITYTINNVGTVVQQGATTSYVPSYTGTGPSPRCDND
ncbi:MAG: hypothetical protein M3Y50_02640 [Acidobacteriota bacterium]|nr:hypothetical protein [Acidobacteriota bacterium]